MRAATRSRSFVALLAVAGCDRVFGLEHLTTSDAAADAFAKDPVAGLPFSTPIPIAELQTASEEDDPSMTADQLELYLYGNGDIYVARRASIEEPWSAPSVVSELDSALTSFRPCVTSDGLAIYFTRRISSSPRNDDIYVATRTSREDTWGAAVPLPGSINTSDNELGGWSSPDGLQIVVERHVDGGQHDLYWATRPDQDVPFALGPALDFANTSLNEGGGWFNAAQTIFVFDSDRIGGSTAIWEAFRDGESWMVVAHPELDSSLSDGTPWLSPDGRTIVFSSTRNVTNDDLYIATR